eukprot:gene6466-7130_t
MRREEHQRVVMYGNARKDMVSRWKKKNQDSPYKVLQFQKELQRMAKAEREEYERMLERRKADILASMTGEYRDPYLDRGTTAKLPVSDQLALQYRKHVLDERKVEVESQELDYLAADEFRTMERKFPNLQSFSSSLTSPTYMAATTNTTPFGSPQRRQSASSSIMMNSSPAVQKSRPVSQQQQQQQQQKTAELPPRLPMKALLSRKGPNLNDLPQLVSLDMSSESTMENNRRYSSPEEDMKAIAEDISLEFARIEKNVRK